MSMIGKFIRVSASDLEQYLRNSNLLEDRIDAEIDTPDPNFLDIGKTWDGIYFILNGNSIAENENPKPPLSWTFLSGQLIDENQDLGYGPANYCTPDQVRQVSEALDLLSKAFLKDKYDPAKMDELELYPFAWTEDEKGFEYLLDAFENVKEFYSIAAKNNEAIITYIS